MGVYRFDATNWISPGARFPTVPPGGKIEGGVVIPPTAAGRKIRLSRLRVSTVTEPVAATYQQRFSYAQVGKIKPTNANTGVLTRNPADYPAWNSPNTTIQTTLTAANTPAPDPVTGMRIIEGVTIYGSLKRGVSNVWIRNCILRGVKARPSSSTGIIELYDNDYDNWVISECHFLPQFPCANQDAIIGSNFTLFNCNVRHCVDGTGVFSGSSSRPSTRNTNVHVYMNLFEDAVYFNGPYYAKDTDGNSYLKADSSTWNGSNSDYISKSGQPSSAFYSRPLTGVQDLGHGDGNHSDFGTEIQGGYGNISRPQGGDFSMYGTGIHFKGNFVRNSDVENTTIDLTGLGIPVPGQAGSLAGSSLGTQDCAQRVSQRPSIVGPVTNGKRVPGTGNYAITGTAFILALNVNKPQYTDNNNMCVVIEENWIDDAKCGLRIEDKGYANVGMAFLNNRFGDGMWYFSSLSNPSIRPIYIGRAHIFATAKDGSPGLATNTWEGSYWRTPGTPLAEGRTGGIQFDDVSSYTFN